MASGFPTRNVRLAVHTGTLGTGKNGPMRRRVLIVDDDRRFRELLRQVLDEGDEFDVVGEAHEGGSGVSAARELAPDVVLLDVNLPDTMGFEIVPDFPGDARVVMISSRDDEAYARMADDAGAAGFVSKHDLSPAALAELLDELA